MVQIELPPAVSEDEWDEEICAFKQAGKKPDFESICYFAVRSPALRVAFDSDFASFFPSEVCTDWVRSIVIKVHGVEDIPLEGFDAENIDKHLALIIKKSEIDPDFFDGLSQGLAALIMERWQLHDAAIKWLADVLNGRATRPKKSRGQHRFANHGRDFSIIKFLYDMESIGAPIAESEASSTGATACHAIKFVFDGLFPTLVPSAKTLMNIWSRRNTIDPELMAKRRV